MQSSVFPPRRMHSVVNYYKIKYANYILIYEKILFDIYIAVGCKFILADVYAGGVTNYKTSG